MKSTRSIRSLKSIRSSKSRSATDEKISEMESFDDLLITACAKFNCTHTIAVKNETKQDDYYKNLIKQDVKGKAKPITLVPQLTEKTSKASTPNSDNTSNISEISCFEMNTITVTAIYDNYNTLTEILIEKRKEIPLILLKVIRFLVPYYKNLSKFTITKCKMNMRTIYELSKILEASTIDSVCLDGSPMPLGDFTMLLKTPNLTNLSLCRCNINDHACELIASMLKYSSPASNLLILNLSSNRITDVGAKYIAEALRTNRHLRYLNLADNRISDEGASYILDVLKEFPLTCDEIMIMKRSRLDYLRLKNALYAKYMAEYCYPSFDEISDITRLPKKKKPKANTKKEKSILNNWSNDESLKVRAEMMTAEILGPYKGPFHPEMIKFDKGYYYSIGNMTLHYLNLAYNNLSYLSIKKLWIVVTQQTTRSGNRGLTKVVIDGNNLPISCLEMDSINMILGRKVMRYSSRVSEIVRRRPKGSLRIEN